MPGEKRKCITVTIHTKAEILHRHLYEHERIGDLTAEYNMSESTISSWKNIDRIFQEAAEVGPD